MVPWWFLGVQYMQWELKSDEIKSGKLSQPRPNVQDRYRGAVSRELESLEFESAHLESEETIHNIWKV